LSYGERQRIKRILDSEGRRLNGVTEGIPNRFQRAIDEKFREKHPEEIRANMKKLERVLSEGSPDSISKRERIAKEKLAAKEREWLQSQMVSRKAYHIGWRDIKEGRATKAEYDKAVRGCVVEQSSQFAKHANRYKNLMREIDPENPDASNIENIRPETA